MRYRGAWRESVELSERVSPVGAGRHVLSECEVELGALRDITCIHSTPFTLDARGDELSANRESGVVLIPFEALDDVVRASELASEDRFWALIDRMPRGLPRIPVLRRLLKRCEAPVVLAFQARLVERARTMVDTRGTSWGLAVNLILSGRDAYEQRLNGTRDMPRDSGGIFADVTDVAEDILGTRIEVPGIGDGATIRQVTTPGGATRPRWLSWRVIGGRKDERRELFYFGEWPPDVPVREMLRALDDAVAADGFTRTSARETWLPDGIHRITASFLVPYEINRPGPDDLHTYVAENSIEWGDSPDGTLATARP